MRQISALKKIRLQLTLFNKTPVYDACVFFHLRPMSKHLRWEQEKPRKIGKGLKRPQ